MQDLTYARPSSIEEAVDLLQRGGDTARVLAGGTDIIVQARGRRSTIDALIDIKHVPGTTDLSFSADSGLTIGAATPCYRIYRDETVSRLYPGLVDAAVLIGGTGVQGRASFGGNLCNSSPSGDSIPAQIVMEGIAHIVGPNGERTVPVEQFCAGPGRNVLEPGEFLLRLTFPAPVERSGARFLRFIPRNEMDIAVVNAAAHLRFEGDTVSWARISVGAAAPTPLLVEEAAQAIVGQPLSDDTIARAAAASSAAVSPIDDMRGTVKQRRHLAGVLTTRTIRDAQARANGEQVGHA